MFNASYESMSFISFSYASSIARYPYVKGDNQKPKTRGPFRWGPRRLVRFVSRSKAQGATLEDLVNLQLGGMGRGRCMVRF